MQPPKIGQALCFLGLAAATVWCQPQPQSQANLLKLREKVQDAEKSGKSQLRMLAALADLAEFCFDDEHSCKSTDGDKALKQALSLRQSISPKDLQYAECLLRLGQLAGYETDSNSQLLLYGEAAEIQKANLPANDIRISMTHAQIAQYYADRNDKDQARRTMNYALELQARGNQRTEAYADLVRISAELYADQRDKEKARQEVQRAVNIYRAIWGPRDPKRAHALRLLIASANGKDREDLYIELIEFWKTTASPASEEYNEALCNLAAFYFAEGRYGESVRAYEKAVRTREEAKRRDPPLAEALEGLARTQRRMNAHYQAAETYEKARSIRQGEANLQPHISLTASIVEEYSAAGELASAEREFKAMENEARLRLPFHLIRAADALGEAYVRAGQMDEAIAKFQTSAAAAEAHAVDEREVLRTLHRLAKAYTDAGRYDDANRVSRRIIQVSLTSIGEAAKEPGSRAALVRSVVLWIAAILAAAVLVAGIAFYAVTRVMDRKLAKLFLPAPAAQPVTEDSLAEPAAMEPQVEVASPTVVRTITFHGDGGDLFAMRVVNLLLSLITLGFYSFWGKAKVRRYLCGQGEMEGDRFAFHGTGRELLTGWLKGAPLLAFIIFFPNILPFLWQKVESVAFAQLAAGAAFLLLWPVARAGAYRYRINRMSWRGIRFSFSGRTIRYFATSVAGYFLCALTWGIYVPVLFVKQRRILFSQTSFGSERFSFEGRGRDLLPAWLCALPVVIATAGLFWPWWSAFRYRYVWAKTTVGAARFRFTATGWSLAKLWLSNALLIVFTLGIGWSWASVRTLRFWSSNLEITGNIDVDSIRQKAVDSSAVGESFADFLGFDFGF